MVQSSNSPVVNGICDPWKSWARYHFSFIYFICLYSISFYCQNVTNSGTPNSPSIINYWVRNFIPCKKFAVQTPLWSLEFVIHQNVKHDTIAVSNLTRSWYISTHTSNYCCKKANLGTANLPKLLGIMTWWVR